mgnify:CR=1 FL=1
MNIQSRKEKKLIESINLLEGQLDDVRAQRTITCTHCEKRTQIKKATIIKDNYYVQPSGCTGGDYWTFNEYLFYCSKCNNTNRAYIGSWDKLEWDGGGKITNIKPESQKEDRVKLFFLIKEYQQYFSEVLISYDDLNISLEQLRIKNKERDNKWVY